MFLSRKQGTSTSSAKRTVEQDWISSLPRDKTKLFDSALREWESYYAMLSVALDEAISLRNAGKLVSARLQVAVSSELLFRLASVLVHSCDASAKRGRQMHSFPAVNPLNGEFFRGDTGRSAASRNLITHQILFGERSRFFQKVKILSETIHQLADEFAVASDEIADGVSTNPLAAWKSLEVLHDDFTTCLRESEVLLKGFLRAVPAEQLAAFQSQLETQPAAIRIRVKPRARQKRASA